MYPRFTYQLLPLISKIVQFKDRGNIFKIEILKLVNLGISSHFQTSQEDSKYAYEEAEVTLESFIQQNQEWVIKESFLDIYPHVISFITYSFMCSSSFLEVVHHHFRRSLPNFTLRR